MTKYVKIFMALYSVGFSIGIICCNLIIKENGYSVSLLPIYMTSAQVVFGKKEYFFWKLLWKRGFFFLVAAIAGMTPVGFIVVVAGLLWCGFLAGNLITVFLIEYGIKGMLIFIGSMFPQIIFYIPGWICFFFVILQMSQKSWREGKRNKEDYKAYCFFLTGAAICILLGIWMESYVNQNILSFLVNKWISFTKN